MSSMLYGESTNAANSFVNRLQDLRLRRNEARNKNFKEVEQEAKRNKLEKNFETKRLRAQEKLIKAQEEKEAIEKGESYEANIRLRDSAIDIEEYQLKKKMADPEPGFSDFASCQFRRYQKDTRVLKPNLNKYHILKSSGRHVVDNTGPGVLDLFAYSEPTADAVEKVAQNIQKHRDRRDKLSRRRPYRFDVDVDFINERNRKYNLRIHRVFGKYTEDIKKNLERGTA